MKHFLLFLLALSSFISAAANAAPKADNTKTAPTWWDEVTNLFASQEITLDTKLITADKKVYSLYTKPELAGKAAPITSLKSRESSVTFYIDVDKLLGGKRLKKNQPYRLDSLSWCGDPNGEYSGGDRKVIISNGAEAIILPMPQTEKPKVTIHQDVEKTNFTFTRDDILEVTIIWRAETHAACSVRCYDAPEAPAVIRGTAFNLTPEGELPEGNGVDNKYNKIWRFNSPAVRIRATAAPKYNIKIIAISALGLLGLILIIKLLLGMRRED
ncbi:MAG: hypothetical protein IKV82_03210 [Akkermansia sp.]|nr:hypothetical protein [Akkermansia sp.]